MQKTKSEFNRDSGQEIYSDRSHAITWKSAIVLGILLAVFLCIEFLLPLRTTVQIGGDEGFELAKATLWLRGYKPYTDMWNDQPPLHTFLIAQTLKHISPSILGPRLITVGFAVLLLVSVFVLVLRISGQIVAALTTTLIIVSLGFIGLSASCMLEIPGLAPAMAALCLLQIGRPTKWPVWEIASGAILGIAFQIKLINLMLLPLTALLLWMKCRRAADPLKNTLRALILLGISLVVSFVAVDWLVDGGAYLLHFRQVWVSHFEAPKSYEYGSPADFPFDWNILWKNWDTTVPALVGLFFSIHQVRKSFAPAADNNLRARGKAVPPYRVDAQQSVPAIQGIEAGRRYVAIFPVVLFALTLVVFAFHKPWWPYYYVHVAIPLCWFAAIGFVSVARRINSRTKALPVVFVLFAVPAFGWMGLRVYLQVRDIRSSAQTYSSLVFKQIERYKPFTEWMYADKVIYSFHAGIPMPPTIAVIPLKRLWTGEMTNERIVEEMQKYKPGLILLANDTRVVPFKELVDSEYRLVYEDADLRLYALKAISRGAKP